MTWYVYFFQLKALKLSLKDKLWWMFRFLNAQVLLWIHWILNYESLFRNGILHEICEANFGEVFSLVYVSYFCQMSVSVMWQKLMNMNIDMDSVRSLSDILHKLICVIIWLYARFIQISKLMTAFCFVIYITHW